MVGKMGLRVTPPPPRRAIFFLPCFRCISDVCRGFIACAFYLWKNRMRISCGLPVDSALIVSFSDTVCRLWGVLYYLWVVCVLCVVLFVGCVCCVLCCVDCGLWVGGVGMVGAS